MNLKPLSNNKLTLLRKLNRKKYREKEQLFVVEGERAVEQVINNRIITVESLYLDENKELWTDPAWHALIGKFSCYSVNPGHFKEIADTESPQGILALCKIPHQSSIQELSHQSGILIATDGIQDPGNLGTIVRTAVWFGVKGILVGKGTVDPFHPKVVRGTAGATGALPYLFSDLEEELPAFERIGWRTLLLDAGPDVPELGMVEKSEKMILVVGNEANGISKNLFSDRRIRAGIASSVDDNLMVESLNASIALSIAMYAFSGT